VVASSELDWMNDPSGGVEMDDRLRVIHRDLAQLGVAVGGPPEEQRRRCRLSMLVSVFPSGCFLGVRAEGDEPEVGE